MSGLARVLLDVVALLIFVMQIMAFSLKRDNHYKYTLWPLAVPPLLLAYVLITPAMATGRALNLTPFELQTLAYLVATFVMAFASRLKDQMGQAGFWIASVMNLGAVAYLLYFSRIPG